MQLGDPLVTFILTIVALFLFMDILLEPPTDED